MKIVNSENRSNTECQPIEAFLETVLQDLNKPLDSRRSLIKGLSTGIDELDCLTTGLRAGSLTVIAGRPCMGKTSLAMGIAQNIALEQSKAIAIFSLDFDGEQTARRLLEFRGPKINPADSSIVNTRNELQGITVDRLRNAPIYIDDRATNLPEIRDSIRSLIGRGISPGLVLVDSLAMLSEIDETESIVRNIRMLAQETGAAIILTSNLSRQPEKRRDKRPRLSDLPPGVITGGADLVMTVYREKYYYPDSLRKAIMEVSVLRSRYGKLGMLDLWLP